MEKNDVTAQKQKSSARGWNAYVTKLWFRILVVALLAVACAGAIVLADYALAKKYDEPAVYEKVSGTAEEKYDSLFPMGKTVYCQDRDAQIEGFVNGYYRGNVIEIPLTTELDPAFDLSRAGVHVDVIEIGGASAEYVYSVLPRALEEDEIPVSLSVCGVGRYYLGNNMDKDAVMTVTTDKGYSFDLFLSSNYIENFVNWEVGEYESQIFFEHGGVRVTAPYTYCVVERNAETE